MAKSRKKSPPKPREAASPAERRLPVLLRRAWFGLNQTFRRRIADAGLTPGQFTALRTLIEQGDLSQRELAGVMSSDVNTIASLLARMETLGWIRRKTHEQDRRANRLHVTAAGKRKFDAVRPLAIELQEKVLAGLTESERNEFLASLKKIADACQQELQQASPEAV